jgi:predicted nucleic acid-binding protein
MTAIDSSVIIAGLLDWHEFHDRAFRALKKEKAREELLVPLPALIESYSVMTRLPSPHRLQPEAAYELLHDLFGEARIVTLSTGNAWSFVRDCVGEAIAGGRVYDAAIATAAIEAGASKLLTLNPRDFESFGDRMTIVVP